MPANLTLRYLKVEREYRAAQTPDEELNCLQVMLREIPKHKGNRQASGRLEVEDREAPQGIAAEQLETRRDM